MIKLNIAYDYDMTLEDTWDEVNPVKEDVQAHAKKMVKVGHNVFIITKRCEDRPEEANTVYETAEKLGIPKENVLFTCFKEKVNTIQRHKIDVFLEDEVQSMTITRMATFATVISVYARFNKDVSWEQAMDHSIESLQKFYSRNVHIGGDHGGFDKKTHVISILQKKLRKVHDYGCLTKASCDYPSFAHLVSREVKDNPGDIGILFCSTGQGMAMTANKYPGIRAALCWNPDIARLAREHNNANVLCIPSKHLTEQEIEDIIYVFLTSEFEGGRHQRRVEQINQTT